MVSTIETWARGALPADGAVLSEREVATLASHPLVEIGGHTWSHPRLSSLSPAAQRVEIEDGKRGLEALTGRALRSFAYPHGRPADFTEATVRLVCEAGFANGCANVSGAVGRGTDPYRLPRAYVRGMPGDAFERRLVAWLRGPTR